MSESFEEMLFATRDSNPSPHTSTASTQPQSQSQAQSQTLSACSLSTSTVTNNQLQKQPIMSYHQQADQVPSYSPPSSAVPTPDDHHQKYAPTSSPPQPAVQQLPEMSKPTYTIRSPPAHHQSDPLPSATTAHHHSLVQDWRHPTTTKSDPIIRQHHQPYSHNPCPTPATDTNQFVYTDNIQPHANQNQNQNHATSRYPSSLSHSLPLRPASVVSSTTTAGAYGSIMKPCARSILERRAKAIAEGRRQDAKLTEAERKIVRRLRNRESAERCRLKRIEQSRQLERKYEMVKEENDRLHAQAENFRSTITYYQRILQEYSINVPRPHQQPRQQQRDTPVTVNENDMENNKPYPYRRDQKNNATLRHPNDTVTDENFNAPGPGRVQQTPVIGATQTNYPSTTNAEENASPSHQLYHQSHQHHHQPHPNPPQFQYHNVHSQAPGQSEKQYEQQPFYYRVEDNISKT